jgi:tocopherol O-methyltransferase
MFRATVLYLLILHLFLSTSVVHSWHAPRSQGGRPSSQQLHATTMFRRIRDSFTSQERSSEELKLGIAGFYDRSSALWERVWGEHMHHGYYQPANRTDHVQAQIDLIDQVLLWANVTSASRIVDVGCGIGGSSRHLARKYVGAKCQGITLSPYQAKRGNELAMEQGVQNACTFQVADALDMPFASNSFDLVWSLESGEHMPDKPVFCKELWRVAAPGGRILIVTWCHRDLQAGEQLTKKELKLLAKINRAYYLPKWCSVQDYVDILQDLGAKDVKREDWSYIIAPFWKAVIKSSLNLKSIWGLLRSGFSTQRGAYAMLLMLRGFNQGLIKFGLITCTKPDSPSTYREVLMDEVS